MKSNITFIALNRNFKIDIAKNLAETLGMFYIDINDLIKYELTNIDKVISLAGLEYYNKVETKTVRSVSTYENTLITLDLDTFFNNDNYKILKDSSLFIYLRLNFEQYKEKLEQEIEKKSKHEKSLNKKVFKERDKLINFTSDIVIEFKENENIPQNIIETIKNYYREVL